MIGSRRVLGDVGNSQPKENAKPLKTKLKHVPLILQRRNRSKERPKVTQVSEIVKIQPKKEPKLDRFKIKTENTSENRLDNPYPKPPYSYMAMIQVNQITRV